MESDPLWYKDAIIYEVHVRCFYDSNGDGIGDFAGLTAKLDYLQDLGITAIWLLPFYPSPLKDDGYDISNYTEIHPSFGTLKDFRKFLKEAKARGLRVITELVMNHTSDQHPWFQKARKSKEKSKAREFYVWSDTPEKYQEARIIFQDFEKSNWTFDSEAQKYFWHRFYSSQPDLNFDNPEVEKAMQKILSFWLKMGVDGVRLDAVPYLYEREGTICENLPETHACLKRLRAFVDENFEDKMFLAEANQWPEEAATYFGEGDECHMAFHFPFMPRLFMAIHLEDSLPIIEIAKQTPSIPENCQWVLFLRNHDELTLEMVTDEERDYMWNVYAQDEQARINLGIRRRLSPLLQKDRRKIELMNTLLFSLTGTPSIYYGDEIGMGDNIYLGDRNGVRTPMQWTPDRNAGFSSANPQALYQRPIVDPEYHFETLNVEAEQNNPFSLLRWTKQLIALRKHFKAFGRGTLEFLLPKNRKVLVYLREYEGQILLIVANLSRFAQYVELDLKKYNGFHPRELFSGEKFPDIGEWSYLLTLGPYGYYWFSLEKKEERRELRSSPLLNVRGKEERIFERKSHRTLEHHLYDYLKLRNSTLDKLHILDHLALEEGIHLIIVHCFYTIGLSEKIPFYLAISSEAEPSRDIIITFQRNNALTYLREIIDEVRIKQLAEKMIHQGSKHTGEQGEIVGIDFTKHEEQGIIKIFRHAEKGRATDVVVKRFLSEHTTFRGFVPLFGTLEYQSPQGEILTLAEEIAPFSTAQSAFKATYDHASRFLHIVESLPELTLEAISQNLSSLSPILEHLGNFLAEYHLAISSSPSTDFSSLFYTPFYQRSLYQSIRKKCYNAGSEWEERLYKILNPLLTKKFNAVRVRHHGSMDLNDLLFDGKDFKILSFKENQYKRSPLIDLASLQFSFVCAGLKSVEESVARGVYTSSDRPKQEKRIFQWALAAGNILLESYLKRGETHFFKMSREDIHLLFDILLLERCCDEKEAWHASEMILHALLEKYEA